MSDRAQLFAVLLLTAASCGGSPQAVPPAAAIETVDAPGVVKWVAAQRGKPVLVNYWATWCAPCVAELPDLLAATPGFRERGGVVVGVAMELVVEGVSVAQAKEMVAAKAVSLGLDFPLLVCTADDLIAARTALGVDLGALPQTFVYDRAGKMVAQHEGKATKEQFVELADSAAR